MSLYKLLPVGFKKTPLFVIPRLTRNPVSLNSDTSRYSTPPDAGSGPA